MLSFVRGEDGLSCLRQFSGSAPSSKRNLRQVVLLAKTSQEVWDRMEERPLIRSRLSYRSGYESDIIDWSLIAC